MEGIILFIIIFVVYSIIQTVRAITSGNADVKGTPVLGEVFPTIDVQEEMPQFRPKPEKDVAIERRVPKKRATKPETHNEKPLQVTETTEKERHNISLKNRSAAKRAFIEAEIFNRKY